MSEWVKLTLGDVADIIPGYAFKGKHFGDRGVHVIKIKNIVPPYISVEDSEKVDLSAYPQLELYKYRLKKGDFVVAMTGATIGKVGKLMTDAEVFVNQRVAKISPRRNVVKGFVYYSLVDGRFETFIQNNIDSHSAQENISGTSIGRFPILLPPLSEQEAIAGILSSLDDKIDLLHRQNQTLEALAQTLFRHWFTDQAEYAVKLTDLVEINPRLSLHKGIPVPYLEMKNVRTDSCAPSGWYDREYSAGMRFQNGDTLMARITPCLENGKVAYVNFLEEDEIGWGSTEFLVLRAKSELPSFYTYLLAKDSDFRSFAIKTMTGSSGRQRVQITSLYDYELGYPSQKMLEIFKQQITSIEQQLKQNSLQIRTLEKLRDMLLPKLMSGEVRVLLSAPEQT